MNPGAGLVGIPSFSVQRSVGQPLGSSVCHVSEPGTPCSMELSPPAPNQSPHHPESPPWVPSGESGCFSEHLSLTGEVPLCEPSSLVGGTLSLALMVLIFTVVMAKVPCSAELGFDPEKALPSLRSDKNWEASHLYNCLEPPGLRIGAGVCKASSFVGLLILLSSLRDLTMILPSPGTWPSNLRFSLH